MTKLQLVDAVGKALDDFLDRTGQHQKDFGERLGLSLTTIRIFRDPGMRGRPLPGLFAIERILNHFGYTVSFVIKPISARARDLWNNERKIVFEEDSKWKK